jgi:hypothetical protein
MIITLRCWRKIKSILRNQYRMTRWRKTVKLMLKKPKKEMIFWRLSSNSEKMRKKGLLVWRILKEKIHLYLTTLNTKKSTREPSF